MKSMIRIKIAPESPSKYVATAGGTKPAPASLEVMGSIRAVPDSPMEVARENGIENQQILEKESEHVNKNL
jgi:hypothetical protein